MLVATAVIPVSPQHHAMRVYKDAIASVQAQTIATDYRMIVDEDGRGAAWARNQALDQIETPFVIFLDADDVLDPRFVERTLEYYEAGTYVYTDWVLHGQVRHTPKYLNSVANGQEHIITTLLPTIAAQLAGGFDETLDYLEDEDFYRRLHARGWRGVQCPEALVTYRRDHGFSLVNRDTQDDDLVNDRVEQISAMFDQKYRRYSSMTAYNDPRRQAEARQRMGEQRDNDVLCTANYSPAKQVGAITRRVYPRTGLGRLLWVDRDDAEAAPHLFTIIGRPVKDIAPDVERVRELARRATVARDDEPDVQSMTRDELKSYCEQNGIEAVGTGRNGYIKKSDYLRAVQS